MEVPASNWMMLDIYAFWIQPAKMVTDSSKSPANTAIAIIGVDPSNSDRTRSLEGQNVGAGKYLTSTIPPQKFGCEANAMPGTLADMI